MAIKSGQLGTATETFRRMGLAVTDPKHKDAYFTSCHAYTARIIQANPEALPDDANIILLGLKGEVLHSIITTKDGEIVADTQRNLRKLPSDFNTATGKYTSKLEAGSLENSEYDVIETMTVGDFRQNYMQQAIHELGAVP